MSFHGAHGRPPVAAARTALFALALSGAVVACKPTALVSANVHKFNQVTSTGVIGGTCGPAVPDASPVLHFSLIDTNGEQILPGSELGQFRLDLGTNFTVDNIALQGGRGVIFPSPDVPCDGLSEGAACPDQTLADAGFTCLPPDPSVSAADLSGLVCALPEFPIDVSPNATVGYEGDDIREKAVLVLIHNGASMLGLTDAGAPNGASCSADRFDQRTRGVLQMLQILGEEENPYRSNTRICVGSFDITEPNYRHPDGETPADCFLLGTNEDGEELNRLVTQIGSQETNQGRNPWGAVIDGIGRFNEWAPQDAQRHLVLITDGDVSPDREANALALGQTFETAEQAALNNEVAVHVVQLDPQYRAADCFPAPAPGVVDEFARIACSTGGSYAHSETPESLSANIEDIGHTIPGSYSVPLNVDSLASLPLGPYKVSATLTVTVDDQTESLILSAVAGSGQGDRVDQRMSINNRGACTPDSCHSIYECNTESGQCEPAASTTEAPEGSGEGA